MNNSVLNSNLEPLIVSLFDTHSKKLNENDRNDFEEYIAQGEYELALSILLAAIKIVGIELSRDDGKKIDEIYRMMGIPNPDK